VSKGVSEAERLLLGTDNGSVMDHERRLIDMLGRIQGVTMTTENSMTQEIDPELTVLDQ
jgi:hypothetical protein